MKEVKPHVAALLIQCNFAGMYLLSKVSFSSGMEPSVYVAYRQAFATLALGPFAFFCLFRSKGSSFPPLTWRALCKIFIISAYGLALSFNLSFVGLKYTSVTFSSAILSISPTTVFIMAVCLRVESLAITQRHGIAKVAGSIVGLSGALAFTFYKGPALFPTAMSNVALNSAVKSHTRDEWIKGAFLVVAAQFIWSHWLVLQGPLLKQYPGMLRLTTLQCGFSFIAATIYGAAVERDMSSWKLGWDINLLSVSYCGVVVTAVSYWLQAWVIQQKGPVFIAIYCPLTLILAAIFSAIFLKETLYCGSILGAVLIVGGLYSFLWGQNREPRMNLGPTIDVEAGVECITNPPMAVEEQPKRISESDA